MRRSTAVLGALAFVPALAGCGGGEHAERSLAPAPPPPPAAKRRPACTAGSVRELGSERTAYVAIARRPTAAYRAPRRGRFARFGRLNRNGVRTVFGVLAQVAGRDCKPRWYRVQLPLRPNGATGYVPASDVVLAPVRTRIVVDLSERRVTLFRDGQSVLETVAAVGAPATPTPTGRFYVNQRLIPLDTSGPYGPAAIGISAFSEVLRDWPQGGPVAIHGTNDPGSVGKAASNGCIRLHNDVLTRVFAATPAGTPVIIRA